MKKFGYLACMLLLLAGTVSCGGNDPLSKSSAKKAVEKEAMFAKDSQVAQFETGFYEASPELMNKLAQLKAAGVITYSVETAIETTRERADGYPTIIMVVTTLILTARYLMFS